MDDPSVQDIKDVVDMLEDEMSKTNFLNSSGFVEDEVRNNFEGLIDETCQDFIMFHGENDNHKALQFVRQMRNETIKRLEDFELESEHHEDAVEEESHKSSNSGDAEEAATEDDITSKTQQDELQAEATEAGRETAEESGRGTP